MAYYLGIGLTIISNVFYHVIQKAIPGNANPILSLIVTYLTAAAACILLLPFFQGGTSLAASIKQLNWGSLALGLAIIGWKQAFFWPIGRDGT